MAIDRSTTQPFRPADARRRAILGIGAAVASLFLVPPLFGLAGVAFGYSAVRRGERNLGQLAIGLSVGLAVFSTWLALQLAHRL